MSNQKETTEDTKPEAAIDTARLLGDRAGFNPEDYSEIIIDRLHKGLNQDPRVTIDHEMLEENWTEWVDNIHDRGIVFGLELAKKAWSKGHGFSEIMENIAHYKAEIEEYES